MKKILYISLITLLGTLGYMSAGAQSIYGYADASDQGATAKNIYNGGGGWGGNGWNGWGNNNNNNWGGWNNDTAPNNCRVWYDGCNTCSRQYPGGPLVCTKIACFAHGQSYCKDYFGNNNNWNGNGWGWGNNGWNGWGWNPWNNKWNNWWWRR